MTAIPADAQSRETIRISNQSGVTLFYFHATDTRYSTFGEDLLGSRVLNPGQFWDLTFSNVTNCIYDFRLIYENGRVEEDYGVNICAGGTYTLR